MYGIPTKFVATIRLTSRTVSLVKDAVNGFTSIEGDVIMLVKGAQDNGHVAYLTWLYQNASPLHLWEMPLIRCETLCTTTW